MFQSKVDYCGLSTVDALLLVRDSNLNGSNEKYQPQGQDGSFLGTEVYGEDTAPSNSYGVSGAITLAAGDLKLGTINTVSTKKYALESVTITTAAGAAPTVAATCQEVEAGATDATMCHYSVPALSLTTKQHAQILFGAFSLSGDGCSLTACSATIACTVNKDKIAGTKIASDVNSGVITVSGTIIQTGSNAPSITATTADSWVITKIVAGSEVNAETAYKTYTFELQKVLSKASA